MFVILAKQEQKTINLTCCMNNSYNANLIVQINFMSFSGVNLILKMLLFG